VPKNILLILTDPTVAEEIRRALSRSDDGPFQVDWVRTRADGLARLLTQGKQHDHAPTGIAAVLAELFLLDSEGIETFDCLHAVVPDIPILVLVASQNADIARLAVKRGAQDYLLKNRLDDYLLPKALRNMIERTAVADALFAEKERAEVTLNSIGDAVMSTDESCAVSNLNVVAQRLTGWSRADAAGRPVHEVFRIIDGSSRATVLNPMVLAIRENKTIGLTPNCILIRRDGFESEIEESAAPIHDRHGHVTGAVMVFHEYRNPARWR
jgi:PAS domain S-box-containing protein